jgi:hypothetical protein
MHAGTTNERQRIMVAKEAVAVGPTDAGSFTRITRTLAVLRGILSRLTTRRGYASHEEALRFQKKLEALRQTAGARYMIY